MSDKKHDLERKPDATSAGQDPSGRERNQSLLERSLVKSALWKKRTFASIESARSGGLLDAEPAEIEQEQQTESDDQRQIRKLLALHVAEMKVARRESHKQLAALFVREQKLDRLRQKVRRLEADQRRVQKVHQHEMETKHAEYMDLHDAYAQFQKQSDLLLDELDRENSRLKEDTGFHKVELELVNSWQTRKPQPI